MVRSKPARLVKLSLAFIFKMMFNDNDESKMPLWRGIFLKKMDLLKFHRNERDCTFHRKVPESLDHRLLISNIYQQPNNQFVGIR